MSTPSPQRLVAGILMALAGSVSFALNLITARLAYDEGTDPFTVSLVRTGFLALAIVTLLALMGRRVGMPRGQWPTRLAIGLLMVGQLLTLATAIELIPVGVTILIYYTYPFMISAIVAALERKRPPARRIAAMLVATAGLAFVMGVDAAVLDWRGIVCTVIGAAFFAVILVWSGRSMAGQDSMVLSYQVMGIAALAMAAVAAAGQKLTWPQSITGWTMLSISAILFTSATLCLFGGIARIGPLRASLIDYGSPVWVILFGILLLGETMSAPQWVGAAVVIGAIFLDQIADLRARRRQPPSP
ncbi:MAG: DMT family transporter [Alphaproteobacteria bacterium]|nr:DMT family transporter [Alphaproteobacteria bacterium]